MLNNHPISNTTLPDILPDHELDPDQSTDARAAAASPDQRCKVTLQIGARQDSLYMLIRFIPAQIHTAVFSQFAVRLVYMTISKQSL